jgi:hypothetical protein
MRSLSINLVPLTSPGRIDCCAGTAIAAGLIGIAAVTNVPDPAFSNGRTIQKSRH